MTLWKRIPYAEDPDFSRPLLTVPPEATNRLFQSLKAVYGEKIAQVNMPELVRLLRVHHAHKGDDLIEAEKFMHTSQRFSESDMVLITYGDLIRAEGHSPLAALAGFLDILRRRVPVFNTLHILPFFPYTSDRGFSITDYRAVDPTLGSWLDIEAIGKSYKLMFDGVFNHASSKSRAFQEMLAGNLDYWDFAITFRSKDELTPEQRALLRRPRTSDILTQFYSIEGPVWVWTTFSPDQIDLNYHNPKVLLTVIETLLHYVRRGADLVRLDAATYMWHEPGTTSASLEKTHNLIKFFREVLDIAAPGVALVTETNVPHSENVSYFGSGHDEAQMVYNFALPPLVLHAFYRGDASWLTRWAASLDYPSSTTTFLNILDTHDGVGLMGVAQILPAAEIDFLVQTAQEHGAFISLRTAEGGGELPYEINSTWYSALNMEGAGESLELQVQRFVASRSVALALRGIPGIYFHGLIGSVSDLNLALQTKVKRDVNRATIDERDLIAEALRPNSKINLIRQFLGKLLEIRVIRKAFHPNGAQKIIQTDPAVFAVLRISPDASERVLALINVSNQVREFSIDLSALELSCAEWYGLVNGRGWTAKGGILSIVMQPYDVFWLAPLEELDLKNSHRQGTAG